MTLKNCVCLVTGGAGFVGSNIVDLLIKEKVKKVITLDNLIRGRGENLAASKKTGKLQMVEGDIRDNKTLEKIFRGHIDCVFHQAAIRITQCAADPRLCNEIMVDGTFNLLQQSIKYNIKRFIFASSASVYGEPSYLPMDEAHPFNNTTLYGAAKIGSEQQLRAFHAMYGLPYIALRYFNIYGPRMDVFGKYTEVMIRWIEAIEAGKAPVIHGDGSMSMDFVYVEDVARANILAAQSDRTEGVYNIGTGRETTLSDLSSLLLKVLKSPKSLKPLFEKTPDRPLVSRRRADIRKAKKELDFKSTVGLKEGLKRLIEWRKMVQFSK